MAEPSALSLLYGVWVRITGHGVDGDAAHWSAFGDDAAVAGGLGGRSPEGPVFCGDAIADPLAELHAALGADTARVDRMISERRLAPC